LSPGTSDRTPLGGPGKAGGVAMGQRFSKNGGGVQNNRRGLSGSWGEKKAVVGLPGGHGPKKKKLGFFTHQGGWFTPWGTHDRKEKQVHGSKNTSYFRGGMGGNYGQRKKGNPHLAGFPGGDRWWGGDSLFPTPHSHGEHFFFKGTPGGTQSFCGGE